MRLKQNVNSLINWGFWCVTPAFIQTRNRNWILQLGHVLHTQTQQVTISFFPLHGSAASRFTNGVVQNLQTILSWNSKLFKKSAKMSMK